MACSVHKRAGVLLAPGILVLILGSILGGCGEDDSPKRSPGIIDIPLDMSLEEALGSAVPGDTLNILSAPPPLARTLVVDGDRTPLLIRGDKGIPILTTATSGAIFRFDSPKAGTRISRVGFSGGAPAVRVLGSGELAVEDALFTAGTVQIYGSGSGLKVSVTRSLMREAALFSLQMTDNAVLEAVNLTIDEAGDCGILFGSGGAGVVHNCIIWRSANYGIACGGDDLLDGSGCNDIHLSGISAYGVCTKPDTTDFSVNPLFCDPDNGDYAIQDVSPCAPSNSPPGCGLIGARDPGVCAP
jgi:hypothetical protein